MAKYQHCLQVKIYTSQVDDFEDQIGDLACLQFHLLPYEKPEAVIQMFMYCCSGPLQELLIPGVATESFNCTR